MLKLRRMSESDRARVSSITVSAGQLVFVDPIRETLSTADPDRHCHVMVAAETVVGFFQVDYSSSHRTLPDLLEVHEVQIDAAHQGKGHGRAFATSLVEFLTGEYPEAGGACLTVNLRNLHAYRLYKLAGFRDTGEIYAGGRSGPQHIMRCDFIDNPMG